MSGEEHHGQFLPLSVAAAIAYGSLVSAAATARERTSLKAHLDYIATELAAILPVYSAHDDTPQMLPPERVTRGQFKDGGEVLQLPGMPEPVTALRVRNADLYLAIEQLRQRLTLPPA
jgi:hypothetical protein